VERAPELGDNAGLKVAQNFMELLISMVAEFAESNGAISDAEAVSI
jgi:hypothetical protein